MTEKEARRMAKLLKEEVTCPKCGENIDRLNWQAVKCPDVDRSQEKKEYAEDIFKGSDLIIYRCPECNEVIYEGEKGVKMKLLE